jgi:orotate phosphoribosyltransferase
LEEAFLLTENNLTGSAAPRLEETPEKRLRELIRERTLMVDMDQGFTLTSGRKSHFLFNMKHLYGEPDGAALITRRLLLCLNGLEFDQIAGIELGAVFPVVGAITASHDTERPVRGFIVRKKQKGHGTKNRIEGQKEIPAGSRVVVIDDVTTTGGSLLDAVRVVQDAGGTVTHAITLLDREEGAKEAIAKEGVVLVPLFTKSDFLGPDVK